MTNRIAIISSEIVFVNNKKEVDGELFGAVEVSFEGDVGVGFDLEVGIELEELSGTLAGMVIAC